MSESGYYRHLQRKNRPSREMLLTSAMKEIRCAHPQNENYGVPRMQQALMQRGIISGQRKIKRIMRENRWLHEHRC